MQVIYTEEKLHWKTNMVLDLGYSSDNHDLLFEIFFPHQNHQML